ncbi:MAG: restriction endonuclease subunit S [Pseudomonadota bacterium]
METIEVPFHYFELETRWVHDQEQRLDARFYDEDAIAARVIIEKLEKKNVDIKSVDDFAVEVFWPGRFKRMYASKINGEPFIMPSEAVLFMPKSKKYISNYPKEVEIEKNWILITRSGTVGRILLTTSLLSKYVLSDDLIRLIPESGRYGFIYAYLNSWIGQAFLAKDQYGSTVKHIEPHHVSAIPIPYIPDLENEVEENIVNVQKLREEAQSLLQEAEEKIYSELNLPKIDEESVKYYGDDNGRKIKSFELKKDELNFRLDASYHQPIINQIERNLKKSKYDIHFLGDKTDKIYIPPRFKRPYVSSVENGVRYIRPSDIPLIKYFEKRYLAKEFRNSNLYKLNEGEILVVTDGTIGWASLVTPIISGFYGSNNFAHIHPKEDLNNGYLLAFLLSPYGQYQLKREIFGGVIDHLVEDHIAQVKIPLPPESIQKKIGNLVMKAYTKRDKANQIEEESVKQIEKELKRLAE